VLRLMRRSERAVVERHLGAVEALLDGDAAAVGELADVEGDGSAELLQQRTGAAEVELAEREVADVVRDEAVLRSAVDDDVLERRALHVPQEQPAAADDVGARAEVLGALELAGHDAALDDLDVGDLHGV